MLEVVWGNLRVGANEMVSKRSGTPWDSAVFQLLVNLNEAERTILIVLNCHKIVLHVG